ncbi:type I secretion system permease/ATPase [Methylotuvimicrobium sp. KM2]|uniref:type I secretion system permease/ATPase n=1 Tax=Methylotuvimicrobium sp. KM2 TaxID=3133976 RepID=UPI0031015281
MSLSNSEQAGNIEIAGGNDNDSSSVNDPLLNALLVLCKLLQNPHSADALTAGLPLESNRLTPDLFPRAAKRAGLAAGLVVRPLDRISNLVLPAILLLKQGQAIILLSRDGNQCKVLFPETEDGIKTVALNELNQDYTGAAFFVQQEHSFDSRIDQTQAPKSVHWFWDVIFKSWPIYSEVLMASFLINLFAISTPFYVMNVYDRVVPNHALETLWVLSTGMLIIYTFEFVMKSLRSYFIDTASKRAEIILSATLFERIMGIKMESRPTSLGVFANNFNEFESFRDFLTSATLTALIDLPFTILFLIVIWYLAGDMVIIPLTVIPVALVSGYFIQKPLRKLSQQLSQFSSQKGATLYESLSNLETIKGASAEGQSQKKWEETVAYMSKLSVKSRFYSSFATNLITFLQRMTYLMVVIYAVYLIIEGELTVGGLIACTILTRHALNPIGKFAALLTRYDAARTALESLKQLMNQPVERDEYKKYLHRPKFKGSIEFKDVTFSYPNQPIKALENVSFKIDAGEHVAILGRIGSGKSTVEKLLLGFYEVQSGAILIDGTDIRQIDPSDLRRQIGYVSQDISLMHGSVKDNITLGARYADDTMILQAAQLAGVTHFVDKHPQGFEMPVGERGRSLSGGQRQSIAVARALLLSPPIYVMDEPTNAMDNSTGDGFKKRLAPHIRDKTLLLVTHKTSLLSLVDRLIIMDNGRIIADGPKDQVLNALKQGQIKVSS